MVVLLYLSLNRLSLQLPYKNVRRNLISIDAYILRVNFKNIPNNLTTSLSLCQIIQENFQYYLFFDIFTLVL